jgi:hypothetical protein
LSRRLREIQGFTYCQKISQMPQFHLRVPLCPKGMAAQPTWYFVQAESARYSLTMTELLEANERSQTEQRRPDIELLGTKVAPTLRAGA